METLNGADSDCDYVMLQSEIKPLIDIKWSTLFDIVLIVVVQWKRSIIRWYYVTKHQIENIMNWDCVIHIRRDQIWNGFGVMIQWNASNGVHYELWLCNKERLNPLKMITH